MELITPIFAQADLSAVPANFWKNFSLAMIVILLIAVSIATLWALMRKPDATKIEQPISTTIEGGVHVNKLPRPVERSEHQSLVGRVDGVERNLADFRKENTQEHQNIFSKIGGVERGANGNLTVLRNDMHAMELRINDANEERSTKVHDRINDVLQAVSELRGEMKGGRS